MVENQPIDPAPIKSLKPFQHGPPDDGTHRAFCLDLSLTC
jgi:hypothetical protein